MLKALSLKAMVLLLPTLGGFPSTGFLEKKTSVALNAASATHESAEHDPSLPGSARNLEPPIPQLDLLVKGSIVYLFKSLFQNPSESDSNPEPFSYSEALNQPKRFQVLAMQKGRFVPRRESGPTLINADHEFKGMSDRRFGFCWGFSSMIRNFSTLAFFDPSLPKNPSIDFYKARIDQVMSGKATVIPGYPNFRALSLQPELEFYLKLYTMEVWRRLAARPSSLQILARAGQVMSEGEQQIFTQNLELRLARGEFPKLVFSSQFPNARFAGLNADIHVVLAYRLERRPDQSIRLFIWDPNFYAETAEKSPKYIEFTPDHRILYAPWHENGKSPEKNNDLLARVSLTPENDAETGTSLLELKRFCSGIQTQRYCGQKFLHHAL